MSVTSLKKTLQYFAPNWFATALGTGGLSLAIHQLPIEFWGKEVMAFSFWAASALILILISATTLFHRFTHPDQFKSYIKNPLVGFFYGAMPMAIMVVGAGALVNASWLLGERVALWACIIMWVLGTLQGLYIAVRVTYISFVEHAFGIEAVTGGWLMPLVPPLVSASVGATLMPHLGHFSQRNVLLLCYGMLGFSLVASFIIIVQIWQHLAHHTLEKVVLVPTFWIVLGPLGQGVTTLNALSKDAHLVLDVNSANFADGLAAFGGLMLWGFATMWLVIVLSITITTALKGLPFALTWWSFTFPLAVYSTGSSALALRLDAEIFTMTAVFSVTLLFIIWCYLAFKTIQGIFNKSLLLAPAK